jgi:hypothetical protein
MTPEVMALGAFILAGAIIYILFYYRIIGAGFRGD